MGKIEIYTDGSCEPNPGNGGWAYAVKKDNGYFVEWGCEEHVTNNIMEMMAILYALYYLDEKQPAIIHSDSQYCVDGINSWMHNWKKKGWRKKGGAIKNLELWKEIYDEVILKPKVKVRWIRGHNGNEGNDIADEYASNAGFHQFNGSKNI